MDNEVVREDYYQGIFDRVSSVSERKPELPAVHGQGVKYYICTYSGRAYYLPERQTSATVTVTVKVMTNQLEDAVLHGRAALVTVVGEQCAKWYTLETVELDPKQ